MRSLRGFTLVELLIVVTIIAILAAVIIPKYGGSVGAGRAQAMRANTRLIQELIEYHHAADDVPSSPTGYPLLIDPVWFQADRLPMHMWTGQQMQIQVVAGAATDFYPAVKTFDPSDLAADNAWYNTTNGAFCVRIGPESTVARTIELFNDSNGASITDLAQTTK